MLARVISFQVLPERLDEVENAYRGSLLPETETYDGFLTMLTLRNRDTNEMLKLTLWRDEEARLESESRRASRMETERSRGDNRRSH